MFGFARARWSTLSPDEFGELRRHYCGLCHALRKDYGLLAGILTGWDGRFLALLIDAQIDEPEIKNRTKCPATMGTRNVPIAAYGIATQYAAAASIYLLGEKLRDNIQDDNSLAAHVGMMLANNQLHQAREQLVEFGFPIEQAEVLWNKQNEVESSKESLSYHQVTEPTAKAVGLLFEHTAVLTKQYQNQTALLNIGSAVGRIVTLLDACQDYKKDLRQKKFNAIAASIRQSNSEVTIPPDTLVVLKSYLLDQLREIRTSLEELDFYKNSGAIQNVLCMGLYDVTFEHLSRFTEVFNPDMQLPVPGNDVYQCSTCGHQPDGNFCAQCGSSLYQQKGHSMEDIHNESFGTVPNLL